MDLRLSDPALVAQFKAERQILAGLEHPTVTRLLDGGVTALGEPYLVMEFVDGVPIDRYCDEHRLDLLHAWRSSPRCARGWHSRTAPWCCIATSSRRTSW